MMTSSFIFGISVGMSRIPHLFATITQAAAASVKPEEAPAVTMAASHFSFLARYSPAFACSSARWTGCLAAAATAAWTGGGMIEAVIAVYVPAALMILVTPSLS